MSEDSIKETMDRLYGAGTIPQKKVPAEEMKRLIEESKLQLRSKKGKSTENKKNDDPEDTEKGRIDNYPCPVCKESRWMKLPDGTCRYYCLKCGEVIQYSDIESANNITDLPKTPAPASFSIVEKKVEPMDSIDKPEIDKSKELLYCEYRCNDCQEIVVACGNSLEKAKKHIAFHKECGGRLIFLRQVNSKVAGNKERFSHPRVERAICNGCSDDMGRCPRTFKRMVTCLFNNMDYKMKWLRGD